MSAEDFDLVILGGGVAGWAAAAFAGARGRRTCLVSRPAAASPWCDWLPPLADPLLAALKLDAQRISSETFDRVVLRSADLKQQAICDSLSPCRVVRRDALRDALRQAARVTGRVQHREATIVDVDAAEESVTLRAENGAHCSGRVLIAADGGASIVVRKLLRGAVPSTITSYGAVQWSAPGTKKGKGKAHVELTVLLATNGPQGFGYVLDYSRGLIAGLVEAAEIAVVRTRLAELCARLKAHRILNCDAIAGENAMAARVLPRGAALEYETHVGKRTLVIGDAGGFVSALSQDGLYPSLEAARLAAQTVHEALDEPHEQDVLSRFDAAWRPVLADYLRIPGTDLKFLMPLVFTNQAVAEKMVRGFLYGENM
ncbi:MAG: lycopene cyclase family protein [Phycisphaerae bacterium]|nr:lycopene cyclase family protein [Phycisphaerae bacterium]